MGYDQVPRATRGFCATSEGDIVASDNSMKCIYSKQKESRCAQLVNGAPEVYHITQDSRTGIFVRSMAQYV